MVGSGNQQRGFARLSGWATESPKQVVALALLAALLAGAIALLVGGGLHYGPSNFRDSAAESNAAGEAVGRVTGSNPESTVVALVSIPTGVNSPAGKRRIDEVAEVFGAQPGVATVQTWYQDRDPLLLAHNRKSTLVIAGLSGDPESSSRQTAAELEEQFQGQQGVMLGGPAVALNEFETATERDLMRAEFLAFPLVALLLLWVFRGVVAALLPFIGGGAAIIGALLALHIAAEWVTVSVFAKNFVTGLGLGLGIDYSLLIVSRYREELATGVSRRDAITRTLGTAGKTVAFSAGTVAVALSALLVFPQPFLYSMAIGGVTAALIAGLTSLTLLPAVLMMLGHRVDSLSPSFLRRRRDHESMFWRKLATRVMRRPGLVTLVTGGLLIVLGLVSLQANFTFADVRALPEEESARITQERVDQEFTPHQLEPIQVAAEAEGKAPAAAELRRLRSSLEALPDAGAVRGFVQNGQLAAATVVPESDPKDGEAEALVKQIRSLAPAGVSLQVGGETATLVDLKASVVDHLPLALLLVAVAIFVGVLLVTGSVLLPLKTLLMGMLTLAATGGALVLFFQEGAVSDLAGLGTEDAIGTVEPIVLMVLVLALTTDYAVFVLARVREAHDAGRDNRAAVAEGLETTGRIVTAAALVLAVAVGAFVVADNVYTRQLGFGVAFAVLLDATVVRSLLVPALMALLGDANWWAPRRMRPLLNRIRIREETSSAL